MEGIKHFLLCKMEEKHEKVWTYEGQWGGCTDDSPE